MISQHSQGRLTQCSNTPTTAESLYCVLDNSLARADFAGLELDAKAVCAGLQLHALCYILAHNCSTIPSAVTSHDSLSLDAHREQFGQLWVLQSNDVCTHVCTGKAALCQA